MISQKKRNLFRQESLERLSSPERLDQLMQVVSPKSWLPLIALTSIVGTALIWSFYGRIPINVEGRGVLIYPSKVIPLQSKNSGQLKTLNVKVGDVVKRGQVLATIDQLELRKQLQQQQAKLTELESHNQIAVSLQQQRIEQDRLSLEKQRQYLQQSIHELETLSPIVKAKSDNSIQQQRQGIQQRLQEAQNINPLLKERMETRQQLFEQQGLISSDDALNAKQEYLQNLEKIDNFIAQLKELDVKEAEQEKAYHENRSTIADLQAQLKQLDSNQASQAQQDQENITTRQQQIQEVKREIAKLKLQLGNNSQIISQYSGRILEVAVTPGQVINAGTRLANIEDKNPSNKLVGVTYFAIADGKKIQPGMSIQITPQTVKRERFGGITGKVTNISSFPISKESATSVIGNSEVLEGLVSQKQDGLIQADSNLILNSDTFSGYKWSSSQGPNLKISSGTTTTVRVKVEERAPITFVLPILRSVSGIY
jgi:HlyD family secretion protein